MSLSKSSPHKTFRLSISSSEGRSWSMSVCVGCTVCSAVLIVAECLFGFSRRYVVLLITYDWKEKFTSNVINLSYYITILITVIEWHAMVARHEEKHSTLIIGNRVRTIHEKTTFLFF